MTFRSSFSVEKVGAAITKAADAYGRTIEIPSAESYDNVPECEFTEEDIFALIALVRQGRLRAETKIQLLRNDMSEPWRIDWEMFLSNISALDVLVSEGKQDSPGSDS